MNLTRQQLISAIRQHLTDPLNRQNTAAAVRLVLEAITSNTFNPESDTLEISHINGLAAALAGDSSGGGGVYFTKSPTFSISGNTATESGSTINNAGTLQNISAGTFSVPYTSAVGKIRKDASALNYGVDPPVYVRLAGAEVNSYEIAVRPAVPTNHLFIRDIDVAFGAAEPSSGGGHQQNTDTGTTASIFTIGDPANTATSGSNILKFRTKSTGKMVGIRAVWTATAGSEKLQFCLDTEATSPVWVDLGSGSGSGLKDWVAGAKKAGEFYTLQGQLWETKIDIASDTVAPTAENANWKLVINAERTYQFLFDEVSVDSDATIFLNKKMNFDLTKTVSSSQIASVIYHVKSDTGTYAIAPPSGTLANVNTWISTNIAAGDKYFIKVIRTAVANAAGEAWHILTGKEV